MSVIARLLPVAALGMLSGCHGYLPIGTVEPRVGSRISAELTDDGADALARDLGPHVTSLRGDVVSAESAEVVLAITAVTDRFGREQFWKGEQVRVPRLAVQHVRQRRFSLGRSLLVTAALLGGSVVAWQVFQGASRGGALPPGGGGARPQ